MMDEETVLAVFSVKLKTLRLSNGLTLEELAEMSGVSISSLSKIENRQQKPSFETVLRVSRALRINFVQMLEIPSGPKNLARRAITRADQAPQYRGEYYAYDHHAADITHKSIVPAVVRIDTRDLPPPEDWSTHQGEEFAYVLDGIVEFHTEEYAPAILHKGDSCYLDSGMRHAFVSKSPDAATILSVFLSVPALAS
jgi:transcriptional regulator with XRE-family HTH domain